MVDKTRASKDGHAFHEIWAARKALRLILPTEPLVGIAIEGLSPVDEEGMSKEALDVADLILYYGGDPSFDGCDRLVFQQFKYSVAAADEDFRVSHANKTLEKFALAERNFILKFGAQETRSKITFEIVCNRPIYPHFRRAVECLAAGEEPKGKEVKSQYAQIEKATGLPKAKLRKFAARLELSGSEGNLGELNRELALTIGSWSASPGYLAQARLGKIRELLRQKSGSAGEGNNVIFDTDVLVALGVEDPEDLLPTPSSFLNVENVVSRPQVAHAISAISSAERPVLIHASGGMGKTVFMQSIANTLSANNVVTLFDCFGGGNYRSLGDGRHRTTRGLLHIVNELAFQGYCEPLLPGDLDDGDLIRAALKRLRESSEAISQATDTSKLVLLIDAADNAGMEADRRGQVSFPIALLEAIEAEEPIPSLKVVVSCRTERTKEAVGDVQCTEIALEPFSLEETEVLLKSNGIEVSNDLVALAHTKSGGNPRVLSYLMDENGLHLVVDDTEQLVVVDDLIQIRLDAAMDALKIQNYREIDLKAFLFGLAKLPPPIPISDYAKVTGTSAASIESFVADFRPLLDRTDQGIIFRDEPTETLIQKQYGEDIEARDLLVRNIVNHHSTSPYIERVLPNFLLQLERHEELYKLAFDETYPSEVTSNTGRQTIQLERLRCATLSALKRSNYDQLVPLLIETSRFTAADEKSLSFIQENADLVALFADTDSLRRLTDARSMWAGSRHSSLAIAYGMLETRGEAYRHAKKTEDWLHWHSRNRDTLDRSHRPNDQTYLAIPFYLATAGKYSKVVIHLSRWSDENSYGKFVQLHRYLWSYFHYTSGKPEALDALAEQISRCRSGNRSLFSTTLVQYPHLSRETKARLIRKLADACESADAIRDEPSSLRSEETLGDGLTKCAAIAINLDLKDEALVILNSSGPLRPKLWAIQDNYGELRTFNWICNVALRAAAEGREPSLHDCLPIESFEVAKEFDNPHNDLALRQYIESKLLHDFDMLQGKQSEREKHHMRKDMREHTDAVNHRIPVFQTIACALAKVLLSSEAERLSSVQELLAAATSRSTPMSSILHMPDPARLVTSMWRDTVLFAVDLTSSWVHPIGTSSITLLEDSGYFGVGRYIRLVEQIGMLKEAKELAGQVAVKAVEKIRKEPEVELRSQQYATLARALMLVSFDEAKAVFGNGLDALNAIGAGDHDYINHLLIFASSLPASPMPPKLSHSLGNMCELDLPGDPEKFPWSLTGKAFSRVSGAGMMAKLSRWHERETVSLDHTLPPYLNALVNDGFITPTNALALIQLVDPIETWEWSYSDFAKVIIEKAESPDLAASTILDIWEGKNSSNPLGSGYAQLKSIFKESFDDSSILAQRLDRLEATYGNVKNNLTNSKFEPPIQEAPIGKNERQLELQEIEQRIKEIAGNTDPYDAEAISASAIEVEGIEDYRIRTGDLIDGIIDRVEYPKRDQFLDAIARSKDVGLYRKIEAIKTIREKWSQSSVALDQQLLRLGGELAKNHAREISCNGFGINSDLDRLEEATKLSPLDAALILVREVAERDLPATSIFYLGLARFLSSKSAPQVAKQALQRLLSYSSKDYDEHVEDGCFSSGLWPNEDENSIVSDLIWTRLGSPNAAIRWRAAHAVRYLAQSGSWDIIDLLVLKLNACESSPYVPPEMEFFELHAKLWLLIAVARIALNYPQKVREYYGPLSYITFDLELPHTVMRHFSAAALGACLGELEKKVAIELSRKLEAVNVSHFPLLANAPPASGQLIGRKFDGDAEFSFDYDFEKYQLQGLGSVFDLPLNELKNLCAEWITKWSPNAKSMHEMGGRPQFYNHHALNVADHEHKWGSYLAWHAMAVAAGGLIASTPQIEGRRGEDPWQEWFKAVQLTREDGLWLSDGNDLTPPEVCSSILLPHHGEGSKLPLDPDVLAELIQVRGPQSSVSEVVLYGRWESADGISVSISSALLDEAAPDSVALELANNDYHQIWLPFSTQHEGGEESERSDFDDISPLIAVPEKFEYLDKFDPFASASSNARVSLLSAINDKAKLSTFDPFGRSWVLPDGTQCLRSEAWGGDIGNRYEEISEFGVRLSCRTPFLTEMLQKYSKKLIFVVKLEESRRDETSPYGGSIYFHRSLVMVVSNDLQVSQHFNSHGKKDDKA